MALTASRPALRRLPSIRRADASTMVRRAALGVLLCTAVGSIVVMLMGAALLAYGAAHNDRTYAGVSVAGTDVGGMTEAEIIAALASRFDAYLTSPIEFRTPEGAFSLTPAELGVRFDLATMAQRAFLFGRSGTLWTDSRHWLDALSGGHDVPLSFTFDALAFQQALTVHLSPLVRAPRDAEFVRAADGTTTVDPGTPGLAFDLSSAHAAFLDRAAHLSTEPIEITAIEIPPAVTDAYLRHALDDIDRLAGGSLTLTLDQQAWVIDQQALYGMLHIAYTGDAPSVSIDRASILANVRSIARAAYKPATDASIANDDGEFVAAAAVPGHRLNAVASVDAILASLAEGERTVELVTEPVGPNVTDADVAAALEFAHTLTARDITVAWDGGTQTVAADKLAKAIVFTVSTERNPRVSVSFDPELMRRALGLVAYNVKVEPVDADLRWINGQVEVRRQEIPGRELDLAATIDAIERALATGASQVVAVTRDVEPSVTAAAAGSIQIRDLLASAETYYGNSVANRLHNVELATSRANGALIPPGGVFSFNTAVGEVSLNSGYRTGYGIVGTSNGSISTIPSVGGGICQVATTVFQAAFRAGMPIVERNWHLYWIPRYGQPPSGMKGLDATVDSDYGLDLRFRNATNDWLAVVARYDGANVRFELWGTNPGWEVIIDEPVITNVVKASQQMYYEENAQIPAGQTVFVEHAEDGFDAAIHRVVRKDGQVIDEVTLVSTYAPARNVTLVGTG